MAPTSRLRGSLVSGYFNLAADGLKHTVHIRKDIVVPKTDHPVAVCLNDLRWRSVRFGGMLAAIAFNRDTKRTAGKISNVVSDWELAGEFDAEDVAVSEMRPERSFGIRHSVAQLTRSFGQALFSHCRTPIPNPFPLGKGLCAVALVAASSLSAQTPVTEWPGAEIVEGVAFQGDGSVSLEAGASGLPVLSFWRPVLFEEDTSRPVAGRMDCLVVAADGFYSEDAFDADAKHDAAAETRKSQGFLDKERLRDYSDTVRQLDVVGRRISTDERPSQMFVLTYLLIRDGERLIDIRRNCTFVHGKGVSRPDVLPYVYRYTKFAYAFEPSTGEAG